MAKKITAIILGASAAMAGLSNLYMDSTGLSTPVVAGLFVAGVIIGTFALIALAVMATIDYARRPR